MAFVVAEREVRGLTADEVMRMVEVGILSEDEPVELLHGALTRKGVKGPPHSAVVARVVRWLDPAANADRFEVRIEAALVVPDRHSLPEPDVSVVAAGGDPRRHPTAAPLVVEVAISSLRTDTRVKPALYAAAGVVELWVVDVVGRRLEIFGEPRGDAYERRATVAPPATARPTALEIEPLDLGQLFAGL